MFRDGVRGLTLHPGCENGEIQTLVDCLAQADDLAGMEHDMATVLWERDLGHIDHQVVNPFLGGGGLGEGMVDAMREMVTQRLQAVRAEAVSSQEPAEVKMRRVRVRRYDHAALRLTPEEVVQGENVGEMLPGVVRDYAEVLLEIASKTPITAAGDVVIHSLAAVLGAFLDDGDLQGARFILDQLDRLETIRWCPSGSAGFVTGEAVTAARLRVLLQQAKQASPERLQEVEAFLLQVRRWITSSLLEILVEAGDRAVRKTVLQILGDETAVPWRELEPLLYDQRWYVVRNAVHLAAGMGHEELADHTGRLLSHTDVRVRREIVRALGRLNGLGTLRGLTQALSDPDPSVRILAAHGVGRKGGTEQRALLLARIEERTFTSLSGEEMAAFLGAYAELDQAKAIPLLDRLWKKTLFSTRPPAVRVAAVLALGRVRGAAGATALQAAARSDDPQIRRAAADAVQRARSIRSGGV
jgi:HEAT repeat protein